jgi:hypothetical protein
MISPFSDFDGWRQRPIVTAGTDEGSSENIGLFGKQARILFSISAQG